MLGGVAFFFSAWLAVTVLSLSEPSPTPVEVAKHAAAMKEAGHELSAAGFPGLALPPPGPDGRVHLSPAQREAAQADYARLVAFLSKVVTSPAAK